MLTAYEGNSKSSQAHHWWSLQGSRKSFFYKCAMGNCTPVTHRGSPLLGRCWDDAWCFCSSIHGEDGCLAQPKSGVGESGFAVLQISGTFAHSQSQSKVRRMEPKGSWLRILGRTKSQRLLYYSELDSVGWSAIWERQLWQRCKCHLSLSFQKQWEGWAQIHSYEKESGSTSDAPGKGLFEQREEPPPHRAAYSDQTKQGPAVPHLSIRNKQYRLVPGSCCARQRPDEFAPVPRRTPWLMLSEWGGRKNT